MSITIREGRKGTYLILLDNGVEVEAKNIRETQKAISHYFRRPHWEINCPLCREERKEEEKDG